jgi:DNA-binding response OmpR family regulator
MFSLQNGINAYTKSRKQEISAIPGIRITRYDEDKHKPKQMLIKKYSNKATQTNHILVPSKKDVETSTKELETKAKEAKILKHFQKKLSERQEQTRLMSQLMGEQHETDEDE